MSYTIRTSDSEEDLLQILDLQKKNLSRNISEQESREQGFVTCDHDIGILSEMNEPYQHTIAVANGKVVGYALVMLSELRDRIDILKPMFVLIDKQVYQGHLLKNTPYFVMGQVCVDKEFRSQGIFEKMYDDLFRRMNQNYQYCLTEIATSNKRSLRAHSKVGFEVLHSYLDPLSKISWEIVISKMS